MSDALVTIEQYRFGPEAEAAKMYLEGEGLTVFLGDEEVVQMDWLLGNAIGYIKLQVPVHQAEQALALLAEMKVRSQERQLDDTPTCLACGAKMPDEATTCPQCGWTYVAPSGP